MYLVVIGWMYVVLMMSAAEASSSNGTLVGALVTLVLYGVGPVILVVYLMGAPARNKAIKKRDNEARARHVAAADRGTDLAGLSGSEPDAGRHASSSSEAIAGDSSITPVGKKP